MVCNTCGVEGHDSQGTVSLCLVAVVDRAKRMELQVEELQKKLKWHVEQFELAEHMKDVYSNLAEKRQEIIDKTNRLIDEAGKAFARLSTYLPTIILNPLADYELKVPADVLQGVLIAIRTLETKRSQGPFCSCGWYAGHLGECTERPNREKPCVACFAVHNHNLKCDCVCHTKNRKEEVGVFCLNHRKVMTNGVCPKCGLAQ